MSQGYVRPNGTSDQCRLTTALPDLSVGLTICGWFRLKSRSGGVMPAMWAPLTGPNGTYFFLGWNAGSAMYLGANAWNGGNSNQEFATSPTDDEWFFAAITWKDADPTGGAAYWWADDFTFGDSVNNDTGLLTGNVLSYLEAGCQAAFNNYADILMSQVRVFDTVLSEAELEVEMLSTTPQHASCVSGWEDDPTVDVSGNGNEWTNVGLLSGADDWPPNYPASPIVQTGGLIESAGAGSSWGGGSSGNISTSITVPDDAECVIVGISAFLGTDNTLSLSFTKGGVQVPMQRVAQPAANFWNGLLFYLMLPDTGTGKTLSWSSSPGAPADGTYAWGVTFWKGLDTSGVRDSDYAQSNAKPLSTPTLTAQPLDKAVAFFGLYGGPTTVGWQAPLATLHDLNTGAETRDGGFGAGEMSGNFAATVTSGGSEGGLAAVVLMPAAGPSIESISDSHLSDGQTGVAISGLNFGAESTLVSVLISPTDDADDPDAVEQLVDSWSSTAIEFTVLRGSLPLDQTLYLFVVTDDGDVNEAGFELELFAPYVAPAAAITHAFVSAIPDGPADGRVRPSDWNAAHVIVGLEHDLGRPENAAFVRSLPDGTRSWAQPASADAPEAEDDPGAAGQLAYSSTHLYVCVAVDTWKRVAISTWV